MLTLFCNFIKCWDYDILISECISADALFNKVPRKSEQIIFSSKWGSSLGQICESFGFAMSSINPEDVVRKVKNSSCDISDRKNQIKNESILVQRV